jgi:CheY-like chemotaxis protein
MASRTPPPYRNSSLAEPFGREAKMNVKSTETTKVNPLFSLLKRVAPGVPPKKASCAQSPGAINDPPPVAGSKKILIVDDDAVILRTTSFKLRSQGYAVVTAIDGASAIQAVRREKPNLILLDLSFPPDNTVAWDGFGIITWLRRLEKTRNVPVVIITSSDPARYKQRLMDAGALAFISKPIEHEGLFTVIKHALSQDAEKRKPSHGPEHDICL